MGEGGGGCGFAGWGGVGGECRITKIYFVYLHLILIFCEGSYIFFKYCDAFLYSFSRPPPRAPSLPPQYLSVLYSLTVFYQSKLISCYVMCWAILFAFMKVKSCYFPFELFCVSY